MSNSINVELNFHRVSKQGLPFAAHAIDMWAPLFIIIQNNIRCIYVDTCVCRVTAEYW